MSAMQNAEFNFRHKGKEEEDLFFHLAEYISHHHSSFSISVTDTYTDTSARCHQLISNITLCFSATQDN